MPPKMPRSAPAVAPGRRTTRSAFRARAGLRLAALCFVALGGAGGAMAAGAEQGSLAGSDLQETVSGNRIYLATPLGGEFPLYYKANGEVDGSGEAVGLGKFMAPKDRGRWWVKGNRLCQKWTSWYDGKTFCFTLRKAGPDKLAWTRDDGLTGLARIGR